MKHQLEWLTEEEGQIVFQEDEEPFLTARFYITGEEEAEFRLQDVVFLEKTANIDNLSQEIILKMTKCISECFRLLWEEGLEETTLVEEQGTKVAEILDSTKVVQIAYKECMMKCRFEPQKTTDCGPVLLKQDEDEDGILYENEEKTFSCKIITLPAEQPEEAEVYLHGVQVSKKQRNKGIATACLTELFRQLAEQAPVTVHLQVGSYNEPAVHLYEKLGFEISEELRYYAMEE